MSSIVSIVSIVFPIPPVLYPLTLMAMHPSSIKDPPHVCFQHVRISNQVLSIVTRDPTDLTDPTNPTDPTDLTDTLRLYLSVLKLDVSNYISRLSLFKYRPLPSIGNNTDPQESSYCSSDYTSDIGPTYEILGSGIRLAQRTS